MFLSQILKDILIKESSPVMLSKPCSDHRALQAGDIFVAIKGSTFDGHGILHKILNQKPLAVVVEDLSFLKTPTDELFPIPVVQVTSTRKALDLLANHWFGKPSDKLFCVGITGTNGKTTTSNMIEHVLNNIGLLTGVIGTIDHHLGAKVWSTNLTSPGSFEFHQRLKEFVEAGAKALSVEVSSHALDQDRMSSCAFDVGVFTNLTLDHLDYHKTMEKYFLAKEKFFTEVLENSSKANKFAILNIDDEWGHKIRVGKSVQKFTFGKFKADLTFEVLKQDFSGQIVEIGYLGQIEKAHLKVSGLFNVYNFMGALGVLLVRKIPLKEAIAMFDDFVGVKGRLQRVVSPIGKHVFIDYAHTPDALENVLNTLNQLKKNAKLITVVGCGGDRDKSKRPIMGKIACELSDKVIFTSDNPRTENPEDILNDILEGTKDHNNFSTEIDRKKAIQKAITSAKTGDAVLIAGKGHEDYQILGTTKIHFSDYEVAQEFLK